ncbi:enoyl-CoA hydratase-related protein [Echinimonas agarilytica]|uniref:Enoyl-CoA hydratase-related protein n=1 Tax=Echinimonas agarilytica TaxID=1215918 RepID=A0AA41W4R5_9GAMM|nr:enoyl-CoA hydratase-related protein [Echinimonas agarilytica]MCM2678723.1 enoyl-CoA hydratase-related protein [Echinimonas agarilytica]
MTSVLSAYQDHIQTITLCRPDKKNALTISMYQQLAQHLNDAASDPGVRVVMLCGAGGNFTAGNDLQEFLTTELSEGSILDFLSVLSQFPKPIVTIAEGVAIGIGTTILLHSDLIFCAENTRLQLPFARLGLVPEAGSSLLLPQQVGYAKAAEWLLLGEPFTAQQALDAGLINTIAPPSNIHKLALTAAKHLAQVPPEAVQASKELLKEPMKKQVSTTIQQEASVFAQRLKSQECKQAITAFFERAR